MMERKSARGIPSATARRASSLLDDGRGPGAGHTSGCCETPVTQPRQHYSPLPPLPLCKEWEEGGNTTGAVRNDARFGWKANLFRRARAGCGRAGPAVDRGGARCVQNGEVHTRIGGWGGAAPDVRR